MHDGLKVPFNLRVKRERQKRPSRASVQRPRNSAAARCAGAPLPMGRLAGLAIPAGGLPHSQGGAGKEPKHNCETFWTVSLQFQLEKG
jgi:hypothetical protein